MKVKLTKLLQPEKFIQSIRVLRGASYCGLLEAKEYCQGLRDNNTPVEIDVSDSGLLTELGEYFSIGDELKLYRCNRTYILATSEASVRHHCNKIFPLNTNVVVYEITGPFYDGYILR